MEENTYNWCTNTKYYMDDFLDSFVWIGSVLFGNISHQRHRNRIFATNLMHCMSWYIFCINQTLVRINQFWSAPFLEELHILCCSVVMCKPPSLGIFEFYFHFYVYSYLYLMCIYICMFTCIYICIWLCWVYPPPLPYTMCILPPPLVTGGNK